MPIVTFTTDFGSHDGYAGAMKGVVLSLAPQATLVDIAHGVPAQDVTAGAVALAQAAPLFPAGTIHVAVVDPGVGGARADLVVEAGGSFFVGPDNGVLSLAARAPRQIFRIEAAGFRREPVSPTFHGRDVFAPTAGRLAAGARAVRGRAGAAVDGGAGPPARPPRGRRASRARSSTSTPSATSSPRCRAEVRGRRDARLDRRGRGGRRPVRAARSAGRSPTWSRARSSPTSAAAASWRSRAATARRRAGWAPSAGTIVRVRSVRS